MPLRIGFGVPRSVDDPSAQSPPDHRQMRRHAQLAERLGFDSVWVPDHFYFEWPPGAFEPFPEAWTLMTAIGATTTAYRSAAWFWRPPFGTRPCWPGWPPHCSN